MVTDIMDLANSEFGSHSPITITRCKKHNYLGMTFDYMMKGKVKINMVDFISKMSFFIIFPFG